MWFPYYLKHQFLAPPCTCCDLRINIIRSYICIVLSAINLSSFSISRISRKIHSKFLSNHVRHSCSMCIFGPFRSIFKSIEGRSNIKAPFIASRILVEVIGQLRRELTLGMKFASDLNQSVYSFTKSSSDLIISNSNMERFEIGCSSWNAPRKVTQLETNSMQEVMSYTVCIQSIHKLNCMPR